MLGITWCDIFAKLHKTAALLCFNSKANAAITELHVCQKIKRAFAFYSFTMMQL